MSALEEEFNKYSKIVKNLKETPEDDILLTLYGLYKQSIEGDCNINKPGFLNFKEKSKYNSWKDQEGLETNKAMKYYIREVKRLIKQYGINE